MAGAGCGGVLHGALEIADGGVGAACRRARSGPYPASQRARSNTSVRRRQRSRSHFGGYRLSGQFRLNPATTEWHGNDSSTPFMMDVKCYRFWIAMNANNICLMMLIILTRISDDLMPVASVFLISSVVLLIYSSALRGKFEVTDYELERRWKKI